MRAIILAAGKGERLKEVTQKIPKPMIRVQGKPILEHNIDRLKSFGLTELFINLHYLPKTISDYFGDGSRWGLRIIYSYEPRLLGTAGAVRKIAEDYWTLDKSDLDRNCRRPNNYLNERPCSFWVLYGDNLFNYDLKDICLFHAVKRGIATIVIHEKEDVSGSGIVVTDEQGRILKFVEKPSPEERVSRWVNAGLYLIETQLLNYIPSNTAMDFGKDVFPRLIEKGENLYAYRFQKPLTSIDTPQQLKEALS